MTSQSQLPPLPGAIALYIRHFQLYFCLAPSCNLPVPSSFSHRNCYWLPVEHPHLIVNAFPAETPIRRATHYPRLFIPCHLPYCWTLRLLLRHQITPTIQHAAQSALTTSSYITLWLHSFPSNPLSCSHTSPKLPCLVFLFFCSSYLTSLSSPSYLCDLFMVTYFQSSNLV